MSINEILRLIADGRTDLVFDLLATKGWRNALTQGPVSALSWFVYYGDVTALRAVMANGGDLSTLDIERELNSAAFFGHWRMCDFLIEKGADVRASLPGTGETPLHSALCKAGRPYFSYTVRLLLAHGADPNARTKLGAETESFMRDARTRGETPLHRAAAYADPETIDALLNAGADHTLTDAFGDTPLSWASWHLRPGIILQKLAFPPHRISDKHVALNTSDHGCNWGNGMERNLLGAYKPLSLPRKNQI